MDVDYGPLTKLIGTWKGDKGTDIAPDPDEDQEINKFRETIVFTDIGTVTNAEEQTLAAVHYVLNVNRISDNAPIHHQTGYWMWDKDKDSVSHSLAIPRAVCVVASGKAEVNAKSVSIEVATDISGVVQTEFMSKKAKTTSFKNTITITDDTLHYFETTMVDIYGNSFEHTDENTLTRVS
ncbi:MAG: heme-binding beta-barrel domain-containing protein [Sulfurimonas sp.]|nr:heme-binding beta-barrel domain-containing protein [Sulfurimonas sp.]